MHQHAQQLGLHRQPAVPLVSLAGFAAGPHMTTSRRQPAQGIYISSPSCLHRQQGSSPAVAHLSTTTAAVADLHRGGNGAGPVASSSQQSGAGVRHPEQPAGATTAGANAWWDADGCFEYRAPLSTTVRRLKVGMSRLAGCWGGLGNAASRAALWSPVRVAGISVPHPGAHVVQQLHPLV